MSVTEADSGKHGTLTLGDSTLVGTVTAVLLPCFYFRADGTALPNALERDEWEFTPDAPPLPATPGFYLDADGDVWLLADGEWHPLADEGVTSFSPTDYAPLRRLIPEPIPTT